MVIFCFCWFLALYGAAFIVSKNKDVFSPLRFVALKYALLNLSFIGYMCFYPGAFSKDILQVCNVTLDEAFLQYTIVQTIAFLALVGGMMAFSKKGAIAMPDITVYNYTHLKRLSVFFFTLGLGVYCLFIYRSGGLLYVVNNFDKRVALKAGQHYLSLLQGLNIGCMLQFLCVKLRNKAADKILLVAFLSTTIGAFACLGGREGNLLLVIMCIVATHYIIKRLKVTKKSILAFGLGGVLCVFYILAIPLMRIRQQKAPTGKEINYTKQVSVKKLVYNVSYAYIDVFAANYFNRDNAWCLHGFFEPAAALFAKPDKSNIPQVDQGVYFASIVLDKKDFRPPLPRKETAKLSWPTENFGFAYANFLIPGVILFFFLQGVVFMAAYRVLRRDVFNPVLIILYVYVIFDFNFSSLRLAMFIKLLPVFYFGYIIFNKFVKGKSLKQSLLLPKRRRLGLK